MILWVIGALLTYFVYEKVLKMYYRYWFYTSQGIPCVGFPLPVVGNFPKLIRSLSSRDSCSKTPLEHYLHYYFGEKLPPVVVDFRQPEGAIFVNDPTFVNELYTTKNRFFDKHPKLKRIAADFFNDSIL